MPEMFFALANFGQKVGMMQVPLPTLNGVGFVMCFERLRLRADNDEGGPDIVGAGGKLRGHHEIGTVLRIVRPAAGDREEVYEAVGVDDFAALAIGTGGAGLRVGAAVDRDAAECVGGEDVVVGLVS